MLLLRQPRRPLRRSSRTPFARGRVFLLVLTSGAFCLTKQGLRATPNRTVYRLGKRGPVLGYRPTCKNGSRGSINGQKLL